MIIIGIGKKFHFIRNLRGMKQKYLDTLVGFPKKTADIRIAQYKSGEISKENYDKWHYKFPKFNATHI